jgi:putative hemolysin
VIPQTRSRIPFKLVSEAGSLVEIALPAGLQVQNRSAHASPINADVGRYRLRLAETPQEREAACRLRFRVFNIELGEGLDSSYETGLD